MGFFSISDKKYCNYGFGEFNKGKYQSALKYFNTAIKKNPENADAWNGKGASLDFLRDRSGAIECLDKALEINPNHAKAILNRGRVSFKLHRYNESLKYYDNFLEKYPSQVTSLLDKASIMMCVLRFKEAVDCLNKIQKLDELNFKENDETNIRYVNLLNRVWNDKGIALAGLREYDASLQCYDKALKIKPEDPRALNNKKITQVEKKLYENGDFIYIEKFAKKYPDYNTYEGYRYSEEYIHDDYYEGFISVYSTFLVDENTDNEFQRFLHLLKSKGYNIHEELLQALIRNQIDIQAYITFKEKILYNSPKYINDFIVNFVEIFGESNEHNYEIQYLKKLIKEQGLSFIEISIDDSINNTKKELDLRNFERNLLDDEESISIEEIDELSGYEFEVFTKILFENMGYESENTKLSGDQGADLVLKKFGEITVVQAKRYNNKVTNSAIQEVVASIKHYNADKGAVITNNEFTDSAIELANSNNIELIDRTKLSELINKYPVNKTHLEKNI